MAFLIIQGRVVRVFALFCCFVACQIGTAADSNLEQQRQVLDLIRSHAAELCAVASASGSTTELTLSGDAKAKTNKLLKQITDLGVEGSAKYQSTEWQGILQHDLASELKSARDCRLAVLQLLLARLLPPVDQGSVPGTPIDPTTDESLVPVKNLFAAWESLDFDRYIGQWAATAKQFSDRIQRDYSAIREVRQRDFAKYTQVIVKEYAFHVLERSADTVVVVVTYSMRFTLPDGSFKHENNVKERYKLIRDKVSNRWLISENYDYMNGPADAH